MEDMNPEQQRIAIAQSCGWKLHSELDKTLCAPHQTDCPLVAELITIPDYPNDLNAMHEAEKILFPASEIEWHNQLQNVCGCSWRVMIRATAAQRAEAFLRTLNLWKP